VGVLHASNERGDRGGFSLYVPEAWEGGIPKPLIVSLHGATATAVTSCGRGSGRRARAACCFSHPPRWIAPGP
jgi:poly(3-hydroxybutyrate) depolymerase